MHRSKEIPDLYSLVLKFIRLTCCQRSLSCLISCTFPLETEVIREFIQQHLEAQNSWLENAGFLFKMNVIYIFKKIHCLTHKSMLLQ